MDKGWMRFPNRLSRDYVEEGLSHSFKFLRNTCVGII